MRFFFFFLLINVIIDKIFTYFSAARTMLEQQSALNSGSHVSRKVRSSLIIPRTLELLIRAKHNSIARLKEKVKSELCWNFFRGRILIITLLSIQALKLTMILIY